MSDAEERERLQRALPDHEVGAVLGRGQFGVVWSARHVHLGRTVAVKRLDDHVADNQEHAVRFRREARTLAQLAHSHVVTVHDYRESEGMRLLIMEMLDGGTLGDRKRASLPAESAIAAAMAAAAGLHHAHTAGVLHRDVKPENLMFDRSGVLKVTDFGLARGGDANETAVEVSRIGTFFGTPAYVAPEQAAASLATGWPAVSAASDQYSIAAVLYELLSGQLTHDASGGGIALCTRRMNDPARPLAALAPSTPEQVAAVVDTALQRDPAARFDTTEDFAVALGRAATESLGPGWLERSEVAIRDPGAVLASTRAGYADAGPAAPTATATAPSATAPSATAPSATAPAERASVRPRSGRLLTGLGLGAIVVSLLAVGALLWLGRDDDPVADAGTTDAEALTVSIEEQWSSALGGNVFATPAVGEDLVVVGDEQQGTLHALDRATGDTRWTYQTDDGILSSAAVDGDLVVVGSLDGRVHAVETATGASRWRTEIGYEVLSSPVVAGDLVVVGSDQLYALDRATGEIRWQHPTENGIISSPAIAGDVVAVGTDDGELVAVGLDDGELRWATPVQGWVRSSPRVLGSTVVVGTGDGDLVALDAADGSERWSVRLDAAVKSSPWIDGERVVVGTEAGTLVSVDPDSGEEHWRWSAPRRLDSSPIVVDGVVVVGSVDGNVYGVDAGSGQLVGRFRTGGPVLSSPRERDGTVYIGSYDDKVYALELSGSP